MTAAQTEPRGADWWEAISAGSSDADALTMGVEALVKHLAANPRPHQIPRSPAHDTAIYGTVRPLCARCGREMDR